MVHSSTLTAERPSIPKMRLTQIVDLMIVGLILFSIIVGGYNYHVESLPKPAGFFVTDLIISPEQALVGDTVIISAMISNLGDEAGNYSVNLKINGFVEGTKTGELESGASEILEFTVVKGEFGTYSVELGDASGIFRVGAEQSMPAELKVIKVTASPYEAWVDEPVTISVVVSNTGTTTISYPLGIKVNDVLKGVIDLQLSAGEETTVEGTVTVSNEGAYSVDVEGVTSSFRVVPTGKHTLVVAKSGQGGTLYFTLDGKEENTPYRELVDVGIHTLEVPFTVDTGTGVFQFNRWSDGVTEVKRTVDVQDRTVVSVYYDLISGRGSCPALYIWNGKYYIYRTEVSDGPGWLGIIDSYREDGSLVFGYSDPWDYIKLDKSQLEAKNGYYEMIMTQNWDEISYIDSATLIIVDHAKDVDVFSNKGVFFHRLEDLGEIFTVSKNLMIPLSAVMRVQGEEKEEDILSVIAKRDNIYTQDKNHRWELVTFELDLGDLSDAKEIKLVVAGTFTWGEPSEAVKRMVQFSTKPGEQIFPNPIMEVKDENGNWVPVPDHRQFPYLDVNGDTLVINLTGLFPTNDYSLRIKTVYDIHFDYIGVDTTLQGETIIQEIHPVADLVRSYVTQSNSTGNFTRYGDVTPLLRYADDKFVIVRQGDRILLRYPLADIEPVQENMERDYFLFASAYFKAGPFPYMPFSVDPLPFHSMTVFPYPPTESYPYDQEHMDYLREYNTREINITP